MQVRIEGKSIRRIPGKAKIKENKPFASQIVAATPKRERPRMPTFVESKPRPTPEPVKEVKMA